MSQKRDMRKAELIIPYVAPKPKEEDSDAIGTIASTMPMVAMFTRNKIVGWTSVMFALQLWLNETPAGIAAGKQPAYFTVGMSIMSLLMCYMNVFFPAPVANPAGGLGTQPAPPVPGST
ncbi:hypothetical protein BJ508DRAFT_412490 [Ascobolus immersus RN42]|uniref:Protein Asterix n=1 Tax=Ascobolus immersus RN42 TaxID=1160509 RepID=A0A3N4IFZ6_ASCIM|nr:hypothetical protein BJ508DRAFT_412490 [Ascobolus immersus RN42]